MHQYVKTHAMRVIELEPDFTGVVKFTAEWCGPCKRIHNALMAACSATEVPLVEVDVDSDSTLPARFSVNAMPTLVFLFKGVEVAELRVVGANMQQIEQNLNIFSSQMAPPDSNQISLPVDDAANVQCLLPTTSQAKR